MLKKIENLILPLLSNKDVIINENTVILKDLDINSYDIVELICVIEEEFDISIPDKKIKTFVTIGDIIRYIEAQK